MISLIRHIEYLLTCHDCVVIPGLGAVLGIDSPSVYDENSEQMSPPCRRYAFNSELVESDGLLINSIARAGRIDFKSATDVVKADVENLKRELSEAGEVTLGRIGRLEINSGGISLNFVPFERDLLTPLSDWLPTLNVRQAGTLQYHRPEKADCRGLSRSGRRRNKVSRFVRNTIGAAAALLIGFAVSTPVSVNNTHEASLAVKIVSKTDAVLPKDSQSAPLVSVEKQNVSEVKAQTIEQPNVEPVKKEIKATSAPNHKKDNPQQSARFNEGDEYIVVVGSLNTMAEAEKYIARQKKANGSLQFGIACQGERIRVYAATGRSADEARRMAKFRSIARQFKGAWVTHRN